MFEWLSRFDKILVTGPQRSGTRICTRMIAYDTGHEYVDEGDINIDSPYTLDWYFRHRQRFVVQCPALCRYVHMLSADDTAIVLMRRSVEDIIVSQERIGWPSEKVELAHYDRSQGVIAEVKYRFWEDYQKERIRHAFEIEYESLAGHPLWIARPLRQGFWAGQTTLRDGQPTLAPNAYVSPHADVLYWDELGPDEAILIKRGPAKLLNATGRLIWNLCDGTRTRQDILQQLKAHFDGVEEDLLARDLDKFIEDLVAKRFLQLRLKSPQQVENAGSPNLFGVSSR